MPAPEVKGKGKSTASGSPGRDLGFLIFFIILMGFIWYANGGPEHPPESALVQDEQLVGVEQGDFKITLSVNKDYIEIKSPVENKNSVNTDGWALESWYLGQKEFSVNIPGAVNVFYNGQVNKESNIVLKPGERILIDSSSSPVGANFRVNKCSGYLAQSQDFSLGFALLCPLPSAEKWPSSLTDRCRNYLSTVPRCRTPFDLPAYLGTDCRDVVIQKLNYNSCVSDHKGDRDFYLPEWRVYLGDAYDWKLGQGKIMILRDGNGKVVVQSSY